MTRLRIFLCRLSGLFRARQMDREIDDEIASHLAEATEGCHCRQGLSPEDARRAARRSFGGVTQAKEVHRQVRSFMWLEDLPRDVKHALRTLQSQSHLHNGGAADGHTQGLVPIRQSSRSSAASCCARSITPNPSS